MSRNIDRRFSSNSVNIINVLDDYAESMSAYPAIFVVMEFSYYEGPVSQLPEG